MFFLNLFYPLAKFLPANKQRPVQSAVEKNRRRLGAVFIVMLLVENGFSLYFY